MDSKPEDFTNLRRLLALKRHEQPPPGYFDSFSRDVTMHIQSGHVERETFVERVNEEAPWLGRLVELISARPLLSGALGAATCALVLGGGVWIGSQDVKTGNEIGLLQPALAQQPQQASIMFTEPLAQPQPVLFTNASSQPPGSFFDAPNINALKVNQPASPPLQR